MEATMKKPYLTYTDVMARYGVGVNNARDIVRAVRRICGGGQLPSGKILPAELAYWEDYRNRLIREGATEPTLPCSDITERRNTNENRC